MLVEIGGILELLNLQDHEEHILQAYSEAISRSRRDAVAVEVSRVADPRMLHAAFRI